MSDLPAGATDERCEAFELRAAFCAFLAHQPVPGRRASCGWPSRETHELR